MCILLTALPKLLRKLDLFETLSSSSLALFWSMKSGVAICINLRCSFTRFEERTVFIAGCYSVLSLQFDMASFRQRPPPTSKALEKDGKATY